MPRHVTVPETGEKIRVENDRLVVPDQPILGYVEGDGIGPDITRACLRIWDAAVEKAYGGKRKIHWCEVFLGEKAAGLYDGDYFPQESLEAFQDLIVSIKGPLTTPVGGGFRSLNVIVDSMIILVAVVLAFFLVGAIAAARRVAKIPTIRLVSTKQPPELSIGTGLTWHLFNSHIW